MSLSITVILLSNTAKQNATFKKHTWPLFLEFLTGIILFLCFATMKKSVFLENFSVKPLGGAQHKVLCGLDYIDN